MRKYSFLRKNKSKAKRTRKKAHLLRLCRALLTKRKKKTKTKKEEKK